MNSRNSTAGACVALAGFACIIAAAAAGAQTDATLATQEIVRAGAQPSQQGPVDFFTGRVRVDPVWLANVHINAAGGLVTFEAGGRSAWHTHPRGQRLLVISGVGLTQEWGKPRRSSGLVMSCGALQG